MHAKIWSDMFVLGLPILEKILRPLIVYAFLIVALRLAGKRELAQLNPFDLVVLLTLSNTVQNAIIGDDNSVSGGLIGAATLLLANYFVVRTLYSHTKLGSLVEGKEDVLIEKGKVIKARLKDELITMVDLEAAAHRQGFASLSEVDRAILEPGGTVCFFAKQPIPEELRHREVMERLERLTQELAQLRSSPAPPQSQET
jgi:uncharacterized membrane protein YcaP (DUF421 family)